jgi:hypothetical protein
VLQADFSLARQFVSDGHRLLRTNSDFGWWLLVTQVEFRVYIAAENDVDLTYSFDRLQSWLSPNESIIIVGILDCLTVAFL